ncbi:MAG TPA: R3H domain-containing nucleic acid-binding protein [Candidatus Dojkabacteria bacterium]|mgnify:CR=1 FL=1|nr:R3H domain-containing nucleic acid-binding protein [Candidatus Dojkabacteria bacterium]
MEKTVKKELDTLLSLLEIEAEYEFKTEKVDDTEYFKISFAGDNLGYLIGNHGKHLESLQYIFSMMLRNKLEEGTNYRVIMDVCGYKEEKSRKIERVAMQKADDARILGEPIELEPMSPADRRVVHVALQVFDDIKTESVGEGMDRRVRIIPVSDKKILSSHEEEENEEEAQE